jgi:hypothetical protein
MNKNITLNVSLSSANAASLLKVLNREVETLQRVNSHSGSEELAEATRAKDAINSILMALEAATKAHRHAGTGAVEPVPELLSRRSAKLASLEAAIGVGDAQAFQRA